MAARSTEHAVTWIDYAQSALEMCTAMGCDIGHSKHDWLMIPVKAPGYQGHMMGFYAEHYRDTVGYCPGDDDVSRTLDLYGIWEPIETSVFLDALERCPGIVIDFGSQIGWYSMLATHRGHDVLAVEPLWEHAELTRINSQRNPGKLTQTQHWMGNHSPTLDAEGCPPISIVKIDIEGAERHALRCIKNLLDADLVANLLVEISPTFNDSYPAIVLDLLNRGYKATALNPVQPMTLHNYIHILNEIPQVDVIFSR